MTLRKLLTMGLSLIMLIALAACSAQNKTETNTSTSPSSSTSHSSSNQPHEGRNTLVIVSHPDYDNSTYTKALAEAAEGVDGVTIRNIDQLYGTDTAAIDVQAETDLMEQADRVVFIFPTYWFNVPSMIKAYLDNVWGGVGPNRWQGKEMLVISHAGGDDSVYGENGSVGHHLKDIFLPLEASAKYSGMTYLDPLTFEGGSSSQVADYQEQVRQRLEN